jgi:hypothetical protein
MMSYLLRYKQIASLLLLVLGCSASAAAAQQKVFKSEIHLVNMTFGVHTHDGKTASG